VAFVDFVDSLCWKIAVFRRCDDACLACGDGDLELWTDGGRRRREGAVNGQEKILEGVEDPAVEPSATMRGLEEYLERAGPTRPGILHRRSE
jgi:hypothetical protein